MSGDTGPYMDPDGPDIWVPRTVPYLEARQIARTGIENCGDRLVYVGKSHARLLGFVRDCPCEEVCERAYSYDDATGDRLPGDDSCRVPAWHFRQEEPLR
jgi:hypothetical protein